MSTFKAALVIGRFVLPAATVERGSAQAASARSLKSEVGSLFLRCWLLQLAGRKKRGFRSGGTCLYRFLSLV